MYFLISKFNVTKLLSVLKVVKNVIVLALCTCLCEATRAGLIGFRV